MRYSTKSLFLTFTLVAAGCAAIFYPNEYLITGFFTATLAILMFALAAAAVGRGTVRAYWIGFVVFGGVYFLAAFYGDLQPNYRNEYTYRLVTSELLTLVDGWLNELRAERGLNFSFTALHVTLPIGHAVSTVLLGLLGGGVTEWLFRREKTA
jgi:hypothetical protein